MRPSILLATGAVLGILGTASAIDRWIVGKVVVVKPNKLVKFISKGHGQLVPEPLSSADPTIVGATLSFADIGGGEEDVIVLRLDASGWSATPSGYKYKGKDDTVDPNPKGTCRVVLLTESTVKAVCKDDGLDTISLGTPFEGSAAVVLRSGTDKYCAEFGGITLKNDFAVMKRKEAAPPAGCPTLPCSGIEAAGGCWFEAEGISCDAACAAQGLDYSELTRTAIGSDGTDGDCQSLAAVFGWPEPFLPFLSCDQGYGCARDSFQTTRCQSPATDSTAASGSVDRICACD